MRANLPWRESFEAQVFEGRSLQDVCDLPAFGCAHISSARWQMRHRALLVVARICYLIGRWEKGNSASASLILWPEEALRSDEGRALDWRPPDRLVRLLGWLCSRRCCALSHNTFAGVAQTDVCSSAGLARCCRICDPPGAETNAAADLVGGIVAVTNLAAAPSGGPIPGDGQPSPERAAMDSATVVVASPTLCADEPPPSPTKELAAHRAHDAAQHSCFRHKSHAQLISHVCVCVLYVRTTPR